MKKKALFIMFYCICLAVYNISAQVDKLPITTTILADDGGGGDDEPDLYADSNCEIIYKSSIYVTNLDNFNNNVILSGDDEIYYLPEDYSEMILKYTLGSSSGTIDITHFTYVDTYSSDNGDIKIFEFEFEIVVDVSDICNNHEQKSYKQLDFEFELVTYDESSSTRDLLVPYPFCDHVEDDDIFACSVFQICKEIDGTDGQTCNNEDFTSASGSYDVQCNEACESDDQDIPDTDISRPGFDENDNSTQSLVNISPNPFYSSLHINVKNGTNNLHQSIEIYNHAGSLVYNGSIRNDQNSNAYDINLGNLQPGIYFVRIKNERNTEIRKIYKH